MNNETDLLKSLEQQFLSSDEEQRRVAVSSLLKAGMPEIRELLYDALGDESWRVRKEALEILFRCPVDDSLIEDMIELLRSSENAGLRNSACEALEKFNEKAVPVLGRYIQDEDADVRKFVIDILGNIASPAPLPLLINALKDSDANVRSSAAENLGKIGDARAVPELLALLDRSNISMCYTVLEALGRIGSPVPLKTVMALSDEALLKKPLFDCLGTIGDADAVPFLIAGLGEKARHVRSAAATSILMLRQRLPESLTLDKIDAPLKELAGTKFAHDFIESVAATEKNLPEHMIKILGLIGDPAASSLLLQGCRHDRLRGVCLNAFRKIGDEASRSLIKAYPESDQEQKCFIVYICGELQFIESVEIIRDAMESSSHVLRRVAVVAAVNIGDISLIPCLEARLDDEEHDVRVGAVESIARLAEADCADVQRIAGLLSSSHNPEKRRSSVSLYVALKLVDRLALLMKDENANVRTAAVFALAELKDTQSVNHLVMALFDEEPNVRMAAAGALGEFGGEQSAASLILALDDQNPWVKCAALRSLASLKVAEAEPAIARLALHSDGLVLIALLRAMLEISVEAAKDLSVKALGHDDSEVVKTAIEILTRIDDIWMDEQAERLISHEQWDIRSLFVKALAEHRGVESLPILKAALETEKDELVRRLITDLIGGLS